MSLDICGRKVFTMRLCLLLYSLVQGWLTVTRAMTINVALRKATRQSTTAGAQSWRAVDGNTDSDYRHGSCTHTHWEDDPYWTVDLGQPFNITRIDITNRDVLQERLKNFVVYGGTPERRGGPLFRADSSTDLDHTIRIQFRNPVDSQHITITIVKNFLTLCEVKVFAPVCTLPAIPNANYSSELPYQSAGSIIQATCNHGYQVRGGPENTVTCLFDGSWSGSMECEGIPCAPLENTSHVQYSFDTNPPRYPSNVSVVCDPGYELTPESPLQRQCQVDGNWTEPEPECMGVLCSDIWHPPRGRFNLTTPLRYPAQVSVTCDIGYELGANSSQSRYCQADGSWLGSQPVCHVKFCAAPPEVQNGHYVNGEPNRTAYQFMTSLQFYCDTDYLLHMDSGISKAANGTVTRLCQANQTWSEADPECKAIGQAKPSVGASTTAAIGISLAGVCLLAAGAVVALVVVFKRRRRMKMEEKDSSDLQNRVAFDSHDGKVTDSNGQVVGAVKKLSEGVYENSGVEDSGQGYYNLEGLDREPPPEAIQLDDLYNYVFYNPTAVERMERQFKLFPAGIQGNHDVAQSPGNKLKNRYKNMHPYDENRVKLTPINGMPDSDYINASPIKGFSNATTYVAAQGPTKAAVNDFWRMIWELNSKKIVMVTNLVENDKLKCAKYWQDEVDATFGDFSVSLQHEDVFSAFTLRTFTLKRISGIDGSDTSEKDRTVLQLHFTAWPDKGVPKYSSSLVHFWSKFKHLQSSQEDGPVIVHCSAGVGRTGTFIALDWLMAQTEVCSYIDPVSCVRALRRQRVNMVQTLDQYIFLHQVLAEVVMLPTSAIPSSAFPGIYRELLELDPIKKIRKLDVECQKLNNKSASREETEYISAKEVRNRKKNRYSNVLPVTDYMPRLDGLEDFYINAVFAPSYKNSRAFLMTQMTLEETKEDFWRLVYNLDVTSIVMMNAENQTKVEEYYWPEINGTAEFGEIKVSHRCTEHLQELQTVTMDVHYGVRTKVVKQFRCQYWPEQATVPPSPSRMLEQLELVLDWQQQTGNNPIVVHCMNGAERSGLYCVVSSVIERLRIEQDVAIPQVIEQMRNYREQVIPSVEQFQFCHEAVLVYMEQFEAYSNFTIAMR